MKKIIITDAVDKKSVSILENAGFQVTYQPGHAQRRNTKSNKRLQCTNRKK